MCIRIGREFGQRGAERCIQRAVGKGGPYSGHEHGTVNAVAHVRS